MRYRTHLIEQAGDRMIRTWCGRGGQALLLLDGQVSDTHGEYLDWNRSVLKATQDEMAADCRVCQKRYSEWHRKQA